MPKISDRGFLFIFGVIVILGCLGTIGALIATGQALSFDGLFLIATCGLVALAFGLYLWFLIEKSLESLTQKAPAAAKAPARAPAAKPAAAAAPTAAEQ